MPLRSRLAVHCALLTAVLSTLSFTALSTTLQLDVADNTATAEFPERLTFSVELKSEIGIQRVVLEYGIANQLTCGEVIARAYPEIVPGKAVSAQWTWEMRQSGSEPPGAEVWWRWQVVGADGSEQFTDQQIVVWLDDDHPWRTKSGGSVDLHWYAGSQKFAEGLHTSALQSLAALEQQTGLKPESSIDVYIYASTDEMREAVFFEPGWTGGLAYADYDIVLIGIGPSDTAWGKRAQAHELTHVLVGHLTFSCLGAIPSWLNEGLAVFGEGGLEEGAAEQLQEAIDADTLLPVRTLSGGFAEDPGQANLSYSQSYSLVNFLIERHGRERIIELLAELRNSATIDEAMQQLFGFNIEGFEDEWRAAIGAQPRRPDSIPTPTTSPTVIPTLMPISGAPLSITGQPAPPTSTGQPPPAAPDRTSPSPPAPQPSPPFSLAIAVAVCACLLYLLTLGGALAIGLAVIRRRRS
ncbi:MAG TPA: peptidase MA family metallohydrolase [Anaerolineales bacterium]|nr:peptidase MA family metallohydrolase [Anaerolineales bacterium]